MISDTKRQGLISRKQAARLRRIIGKCSYFINVNILERVNMTYLIKPYESIGDFVFGTSIEEIQEKYGKPARMVEDNIMNNKVEYRNACELVYENDKLVYGYCLKDSNPILGDIDIFKNSIEDLKAIDSEFIEGKKYILFKNLGICIGGMTGKKFLKASY